MQLAGEKEKKKGNLNFTGTEKSFKAIRLGSLKDGNPASLLGGGLPAFSRRSVWGEICSSSPKNSISIFKERWHFLRLSWWQRSLSYRLKAGSVALVEMKLLDTSLWIAECFLSLLRAVTWGTAWILTSLLAPRWHLISYLLVSRGRNQSKQWQTSVASAGRLT